MLEGAGLKGAAPWACSGTLPFACAAHSHCRQRLGAAACQSEGLMLVVCLCLRWGGLGWLVQLGH